MSSADGGSPPPSETDGGVVEATVGSVSTLDIEAGTGDTAALRQVLTVARQEYALSLRNRWALALTTLFASLSVLVVALGGQGGVVRPDAVVVSLVELAALLLPLVALVFGYDLVVGADESGWLDILFALPVPRVRVLVGRYLGRLTVFAGTVVVGLGLGGLWLAARSSLTPAYLALVAASILAGASFLALALLVSTLAAEKTYALGGVLLLWVWLALVHDLVALGLIAADVVGPDWLAVFVLANPATVFRVLALQSVPTVTGGMANVLVGSGLTTPVLVAALLAWAAVPTWLAGRLVRRRSL